MISPLFQHRHYKAIAAMVADLPADVRPVVARAFADWLRGSNQNYDPDKFYAAAMGEPSHRSDRATPRADDPANLARRSRLRARGVADHPGWRMRASLCTCGGFDDHAGCNQ